MRLRKHKKPSCRTICLLIWAPVIVASSRLALGLAHGVANLALQLPGRDQLEEDESFLTYKTFKQQVHGFVAQFRKRTVL